MKKVLSILFFLTLTGAFAQEDFYRQLKQRLKAEHPELITANKLLVVNVWSASDISSRDSNKQLHRASKAYSFAKLKGGSKGMIAVSVCLDEEPGLQSAALNKDGVADVISINAKGMSAEGINKAIYDSGGNLVQKNFTADIFDEVHKLITR
jgi:hypothetical protein